MYFLGGEAETPSIIPTVEAQNTEDPFDLDKFAYAVRKHETADCTLGYGATYNNCYGLKNGSIAPCEEIGNNRMCIYKTPEESTEAFKKVWTEGYGGVFPTREAASIYAGGDRVDEWWTNVQKFYYE